MLLKPLASCHAYAEQHYGIQKHLLPTRPTMVERLTHFESFNNDDMSLPVLYSYPSPTVRIVRRELLPWPATRMLVLCRPTVRIDERSDTP